MRFLRNLALSIALLWCTPRAYAGTVTMTFDAVNTNAQAFNYYIGPYQGSMDDSPVNLYCVDFANEVTVGENWHANLSTITDGSDMSLTRYGSLDGALQLYQEEAWLSEQFEKQPESAWADIQATMWQIFNPATAPHPNPNSSWLQQAQLNYAAADYSNFRVITNLPPLAATGQVQEFLTVLHGDLLYKEEAVAAPEPSTCILMGLSLVGLGIALRRARARYCPDTQMKSTQ